MTRNRGPGQVVSLTKSRERLAALVSEDSTLLEALDDLLAE